MIIMGKYYDEDGVYHIVPNEKALDRGPYT